MANTISDLKYDHKNARKRTDSSARLIQESLQRYGAARSIVIDEENRILAGNGTIEGAKALGLTKLKVIEAAGDEIIAVRRSGLSEDDKVGLAIADNRAAELSDWDAEMLQQLSEEHDLEPWFEAEDLDQLLKEAEQLEPVEGNTDPDEVPEAPAEPTTKLGDLWILGNHRLLCGDSTNPQHVERLMDGKKADMVFTDPPYNIGYQDMGAKFEKIANDKMSDKEFLDFLRSTVMPCEVMYVCCSWQYAHLFKQAMADLAKPAKAMIVWDKVNPAQNLDMYYKQHEIIFYHGPFGGQSTVRGDVWHLKRQRNTLHPTMKPIELIEMALEDHPKRKLVFDGFGGSGSTLIACERQHRHARLMELDLAYCDVIVKRWEDFTGNTAICQPSATHFAEQQEAA
jgi:DNA modification methylase